tara:strand:- start:385 stop:750 length:366 start_codon:yes stop_codon:yes gene_type:complete
MELKNVEIVRIGELRTFDSGFSLVEFVVKTDEQYPQTLQLQANKEKAENLIKFNKVGDKVDVSINLRGREWTNPEGVVKVFNTIEAWKVFKADSAEKAAEVIDKVFEPAGDLNEPDNDLPF